MDTDLSEKQELFLEYLLECLYFTKDDFCDKYITILNKHCKFFAHYASHPVLGNPPEYPKDHDFKKYEIIDNRFVPTQFNIIDLLLFERKIKTKHTFTKNQTFSSYISASDISNFTYCPVSWSIAKTFQLPKLLSAQIGTSLHEKHKLLHYVKRVFPDGIHEPENDLQHVVPALDSDKPSSQMFNDLAESYAIYIGTIKENKGNCFYGSDKRYIGQPDYIFYNKKKNVYFVVEEKFQLIPLSSDCYSREWLQWKNINPDDLDRRRNNAFFHENHRNQLRSYIFGIRDYDISYGYLVYWRYDIDSYGIEELNIEQIRTCVVNKNNNYERDSVNNVYINIKKAMRLGLMPFDLETRSPSKCAGCVNNVLCGHKTGRYNMITYPYSEKYLVTKRVPFPEELIKDKSNVNLDGI